ncbi:MAG: hypothetical protein QOJ65_1156, partial [Fimbriimonadaceae bacterium]|nr:hypothetical protein [Fimbriimonadaceae bacterium]
MGTWKAPKAGDSVKAADGKKQTWATIHANKDGWFEGEALSNGYVYIPLQSPGAKTVLMTAQGDSSAYVNGAIRAGDPYQYGYLTQPVQLQAGRNDLLFTCGRGRLRVELKDVTQPYFLNLADLTTPDIIVGEKQDLWLGAVVVNSSGSELQGYRARTRNSARRVTETDLPAIPSSSLRKVPIRVSPPSGVAPGSSVFDLEIVNPAGEIVRSKEISLRVRKPNETHKRTFISAIDGSVQYYAVVPAQKPSPKNVLVMTAHGASVEALGQAEAYSAKDWATIVAPTNRRPFGFDWEDWGRLDFNEVFAKVKREVPHDLSRVMLTGHSMGGHGTWSLGSTFPGQFAAIGPSAGWISFWTYTGAFEPKKGEDPMELLLRRAQNSSDTTTFRSNLVQPSIYILHGDKDDNVPVTEARAMRDYLSKITERVQYHEEPGAGHWWDNSPAPGADCVDWAPMFDLFKSATLPSNPLEVDFTTVNPGNSSANRWIEVLQQQSWLAPSRVRFGSPVGGVLSGKTENVALMSVDLTQPQLAGLSLSLDGQGIPTKLMKPAKLVLRRANSKWVLAAPPKESEKSPLRSGPFKQAFQRNMTFVYGTTGTLEENTWARNKARYDAESFYYRGNGSVEVVPDSDFKAKATKSRNVILYGNADTNRAWKTLLSDSPIQVRRGALGVSGRLYAGPDLACLFLRPRKGTTDGLVGAVSGTGIVGMRLNDRLPYFLAGCEYPDWVVFRPDVLL